MPPRRLFRRSRRGRCRRRRRCAHRLLALVRRPLWLRAYAGAAAWPVQGGALRACVGRDRSAGARAWPDRVLSCSAPRCSVRRSAGARSRARSRSHRGAILGWAAPSGTGHLGLARPGRSSPRFPRSLPCSYVLRWLRQAGGLPTSVAAGIGWAGSGSRDELSSTPRSHVMRGALRLASCGGRPRQLAWLLAR